LGFHYYAGERRVRLSPRLDADPLRGLWCVPTGWGRYTLARGDGAGRLELTADRGRLECSTIEIDGAGEVRGVEVSLGSRSLDGRLERRGEVTRLALAAPVTIASGETLDVVMR
jgi:hypothetical protein